MNMIDYINLRIKPVTEPEIGNKIYYIPNEKNNDVFEPCIVKSGCYLDPIYHRVSNFWTWLNLTTNKEESGYGCFFEIFECNTNKDNKGITREKSAQQYPNLMIVEEYGHSDAAEGLPTHR